MFDDAGFTRTKDYTRTTDLLRLLHNALIITIESWEDFESGEIQYFDVQEHQALRVIWDAYLAAISKEISELRFLRRLLQQKIEMFDNKKSGVSTLVIQIFKGSCRLIALARECFSDVRKSSRHNSGQEHRQTDKSDCCE